MYEKINWSKEREVWDRELLWKIRQLCNLNQSYNEFVQEMNWEV